MKLGALAYRLLRREKARAMKHLAIAFPEKSEAERDAITRAMFSHLGQSLFEIFWLANLTPEEVAKTTVFENAEAYARAYQNPAGCVLFTGHCGNWEWMAASVGEVLHPVDVVAREIYDSRLNDFIVQKRALHKIRTIGRGSESSAKELLQTLRRGGVLGCLIDQNIKAENADVDFFGRLAPTPIGPAKLAIRTGAMVLCVFIERRDGIQYVRFTDAESTSRGDDPAVLTAHITKLIEEQIRRVPEQWVWMHRRWSRKE
jgi:KDO2-lipid IV(A) lauroyltransferase